MEVGDENTWFTECLPNNNDKHHYLWEPSGFNNRIIRQDSIFLFGRSPFIVSDHDVVTILIPAPIKQSVKEALDTYFNISESTIYNDTIGFAIANGKMKPISICTEKHYLDTNDISESFAKQIDQQVCDS